CGLRGAPERSVEAIADEIERRPARELDRLVLVVGEDEDRRVGRRRVAPPPAPGPPPPAPQPPRNVSGPPARPARGGARVARASVGVVQRLVEMPVMQLDTATAERVLEALVRSRDKTVERNGHMTGGLAHAASDCAGPQNSSVGRTLKNLPLGRQSRTRSRS